MNFSKLLALAIFLFNLSIADAQVITVDDTKSAQELIENVLVKSTCANVSNFKINGDTFTSGQNSYGYFNAGSSNFPLKEGVILSTSSSKAAIGPYVSNQTGGGNKLWLGDADLDQTLGTKSVNATVLEFDFVPLTNFISFNYIFASNEYQSYFPCEYSDGFAFLIKEAGSTDNYKNIAIIPGTIIPVSSKNVHPLINSAVDAQNITHAGCNPINESYFNGFNTASSPVNYSGQTIKMTAEADVIIGKTYHIKLVIADDGPQYYDSAVFLEAGSFSAKMDLGPDRTATNSNPVCFGENYIIDTKLSSNYTYEWYKDGAVTPIAGETKPSLTVTDAGIYKVKVTLSPSICTAEDEIKIEYAPEIILSDATLYRCDPDGDALSVSDITGADNIIKNNDPKLTKLVYYKSLSDAQNEMNPIENPSVYSSWTATETLYARVSNAFGCTKYALLNIVLPNQMFIIGVIDKVIKTKYSYNNKATKIELKNSIINLPIKKGKIDFEFMERFIAELEAQRIAELEAFLLASELKDYNLTNEEQKVLEDFENDKITFTELTFKNIFNKILQGRRLKKEDQITGYIPFVMAGTTNTGIAKYISNPVAEFPKNSITIDIFGNTFYRNYDFGAGDDTGVYWNNKKDYSDKTMLYLTSSISKLISGKFDFGNKLRSSQSLDFKVQLPTQNNKPNYELMETFITAIQKLVIKEVVLFADRKIEATKNVIHS